MTAPIATQLAFARATGLRACARCRGTGVVPTSSRQADDVQCPDCAPLAVAPMKLVLPAATRKRRVCARAGRVS